MLMHPEPTCYLLVSSLICCIVLNRTSVGPGSCALPVALNGLLRMTFVSSLIYVQGSNAMYSSQICMMVAKTSVRVEASSFTSSVIDSEYAMRTSKLTCGMQKEQEL